MCDHLGAASFVHVQYCDVNYRMKNYTHPSLDHRQGEQPLLARLGPVVILEVAETMVRPQMLLA